MRPRLYGKLRELFDRSSGDKPSKYFWGELLRDNGEVWRARFDSAQESEILALFRKRVVLQGDVTYFQGLSPRIDVKQAGLDEDRDYEAAFDELYGCDADIYGKEDFGALTAEMRGETTSVFISIFKPEPDRAKEVRSLLRELKREGIRIHTSIITVQEASVIAFRRGTIPRDYHARVSRICEIHSFDKQTATTAAKHEAFLIDKLPPKEQQKPRRKWDCFHIATAQCLGCATLYAWDDAMLKRRGQLGIADMIFTEPSASMPTLF